LTKENSEAAGNWRVLWLEDDTKSFEIAVRKLSEQGFGVTLVPDLKRSMV
jgi:hypothetical protein